VSGAGLQSANAGTPFVPAGTGERYVLRLYVTGSTRRSARAIETMRQICDTYLIGRHELEVIDLYQHPEVAAREQIIAAPTLVKLFPAPLRRVIGDLSDRQRVLSSLGLGEQATARL
jgi:circadian clock protein KaiB